jgi:glycerophosphoryl diester phosphodiesterase
VDGLALQSTFPIAAAWVEKAKAAGLRIFVWTVDDAALAKKLAACGVEGLITNRPGWLREQLAQQRLGAVSARPFHSVLRSSTGG